MALTASEENGFDTSNAMQNEPLILCICISYEDEEEKEMVEHLLCLSPALETRTSAFCEPFLSFIVGIVQGQFLSKGRRLGFYPTPIWRGITI